MKEIQAESSDGSHWEPTTLPINPRRVVRVRRPFEPILPGLQFLQLHRQPALVDLSFGEDTEMARKSKVVANGDEPLGWVPLVPFHSIPIVHRKLMMEIMVSLPERHKRRKEMVPWRVLVIEGACAEPMGQRVDRESRLRVFISANSE